MRHFNERVAAAMDLRPLLARIEAATLVVAGDRDFFAPSVAEIAATLPRATVATIAGADHYTFIEPEHRAAWARVVLDFLTA
jgi:pimeloyl-ACP methyl ester carboxylesterase